MIIIIPTINIIFATVRSFCLPSRNKIQPSGEHVIKNYDDINSTTMQK